MQPYRVQTFPRCLERAGLTKVPEEGKGSCNSFIEREDVGGLEGASEKTSLEHPFTHSLMGTGHQLPVRKHNFSVATREGLSHREAMAVTGPV